MPTLTAGDLRDSLPCPRSVPGSLCPGRAGREAGRTSLRQAGWIAILQRLLRFLRLCDGAARRGHHGDLILFLLLGRPRRTVVCSSSLSRDRGPRRFADRPQHDQGSTHSQRSGLSRGGSNGRQQPVVATIRSHQGQTQVGIRAGWFGDEPLSRTFLERVGVRLGSKPPEAIPTEAPAPRRATPSSLATLSPTWRCSATWPKPPTAIESFLENAPAARLPSA